MADHITPFHGKEIDAAMDNDRSWFAFHPGRRLRLRRLLPFEFEPEGPFSDDTYVLVMQLKPGVRTRTPFGAGPELHAQWSSWPALVDQAPEDGLERLLRQVAPPEFLAKLDALQAAFREADH